MRRPEKQYVLKRAEGLEPILARFEEGPLGADTEGSTLDWWRRGAIVGGIGLAAGKRSLFATGEALGPVARWLADQVKKKRELVFSNGKYDMHVLRETFELHIDYPVHDTGTQSFLVDNRGANAFRWRTKKPHGLKELASVYVDPEAKDPERELMAAIRRRVGKGATKGDWAVLMGTEDESLVTTYGNLDPWYSLQLHRIFIERIKHWPQPDENYDSLWSLYRLEQWVTLAMRDMEERGIMANREFLDEWRTKELEPELRKVEKQLNKFVRRGRDVNWNSVPQIRQLLFTKRSAGGLGLVPERFTVRKDGSQGDSSTDTVSLLDMKHPIGALLVQYRTVFKQWSSYATSLVESIADDGAIHPTFKSTGAETGRTSCSDPNLQQQTRTSGVRRAYHPRKGLVFRFADYSQVEMRLAAHFGNEPDLIRGFNLDPEFDTHDATARMMFGKSYDTKGQHRKYAKILNFTTLFGGGVNKVTEQLINLMEYDEAVAGCNAFGIRSLKLSESPWRALAGELKNRYKQNMPNLVKALREESDKAEARGYAMHAFGGHRFFDDRFYRAFNTLVQGTAGVQAKRGLVNVYKESQLNRGELGLMLIIHDELVYESEGDPRTDRRVLELMQETKRFKVPIIADMSGSKTNWQEKTKVKLAA